MTEFGVLVLIALGLVVAIPLAAYSSMRIAKRFGIEGWGTPVFIGAFVLLIALLLVT